MRSFLTLLNNCLVFGCLLCSSCTHYYYAAEEGNILAINEKGDLKASAAIGSTLADTRNDIFSFQAGYSPINKLGIQASYFHVTNRFEGNKIGKLFIAGGAVGYYHFKEFVRANENRPANVNKQGLLWDAYLGHERGQVSNYYIGGGTSNLVFNKTYLQGGFHWQGKLIGISLVMRVVRLDYDIARLSGNIENRQWRSIELISKLNPFAFVETSSRFHVGNKSVKFFIGQTTVFSQLFEYNIDFLAKSFHMGLMVDIDSFFEKKPSKKKR